jgi:putative ABC transport system permease protein
LSAAEVLRFALGALAGHRLRSALSLLGVAIGIAAVVILLTALGEGRAATCSTSSRSIGTNFVASCRAKSETTGRHPGIGGVPNDLTLEDAGRSRASFRARYVVPLVVGHRERVARPNAAGR